MKNKLAAFAVILVIGLFPIQQSFAVTIEPTINREALPDSDPRSGNNVRADYKMLARVAKNNGLLDFSDIQDQSCFGGNTCIKLMLYSDLPMTPESLRKINNTMSEVYYNYYTKYGSKVFFVSITLRQYPKKFDIKNQQGNRPETTYISVLSFQRYNQVSINSAEDAKKILPLVWHNEFIHPKFKFTTNK